MSSPTLPASRAADDPEATPATESSDATGPAQATEPAQTQQSPPTSLIDKVRNARAPASRGEYRPDIDGIRGAAAIMVMGFHAEVPGFDGAYIGLDLFFVVSGYVIAGLLMFEAARTGSVKWGAFYARRARRLIPAKATMLLGVLVLSFLILPPTSDGGDGPRQLTARSAAAAAGFVSNFFFLNATTTGDVDYFSHEAGTGVLLHTWSLSVEEQFYLALPIAVLLAWLVSRLLRVPMLRTLLVATVALGIASAWLAISLAGTDPDAAYYLPTTRAFEFLIGVALALVVRRVQVKQHLREVMGLAGAVLIALVLWKPLPVEGYPSYWALLPCAAAALLVWAGVGGPTVMTRLLSFRVLVGLGLFSYGWYLWHWPFLVLGESLNLRQPPLHVRIELVLVALFVAWLSYRYVESRFYRRSGTVTTSRSWGSTRVMLGGVLAMSAVAGLSLGALNLADAARTSPHWRSVSAQLADVPDLPAECVGDRNVIPDKPVQCDLVPFEPGRPTVMLWGDSHAWMFVPAVEAAARDQDVNLVAFVMGACPFFLPSEATTGACARSNGLALRFAERHADDRAPLKILLSQSYETYRGSPVIGGAAANVDYVTKMAGYSELGTSALFQRLAAIDADVDVVGPTPILPRSAPLCEAIVRPFSCDVARPQAIVDEGDNRRWLLDEMAALPGASDLGGSKIVVVTGKEGQEGQDGQAGQAGQAGQGGQDGQDVGGGPAPPRLIDPARALCNASTCFATAGGVTRYFDDNHVSATMSSTLMRFFLPSIHDVVDAPR